MLSVLFKAAMAVSVAAAVCAPVQAQAQARDKVKVAITTFGWSYVPVLTAARLGFYEQEGLDVEIINTGGGAKAAAALAGGSVDIFGTDSSFVLKARAKGAEVKMFGASMTEYATNLVISKAWAEKKGVTDRSSYEQKLAALNGVTIGVLSRGSGHEQLVRFLAREGKINADREMNITAVGTSDAALAAFIQGRIDAFVHSAPIGERAVKDHGGVMLLNMSKGEATPLKGFLYIGYVARDPWLAANPDIAIRFLRAQQRALEVLHDPERTKQARDALHAGYFPKLDPALWAYVWEQNITAFPKTVEMTAAQWEQAVGVVNAFQPDPVPPAAVAASWTNELAGKAVESSRKR